MESTKDLALIILVECFIAGRQTRFYGWIGKFILYLIHLEENWLTLFAHPRLEK